MKRLLTLTLLCVSFLTLAAQNMKVTGFRLLDKDLTANTRGTEKMDQNGEKCALIKIQTPERGFTFDGGALSIVAVEEHAGETWIYIPRRAQKLIVHHPNFGVLRDYFYPFPSRAARLTKC